MTQATMAEVLSSIRQNQAALASWGWTVKAITAGTTTGTTTQTDGGIWEITGTADCSTVNLPGNFVIASVVDGMRFVTGGNVLNAPLIVWGGSLVCFLKVGSSVRVVLVGERQWDADMMMFFSWQKNPAATTWASDGPTISTTGTAAESNDTDGEFVQYTTPSASVGGVYFSANIANLQCPVVLEMRLKTGSSIASYRLWAGLFSADPSGSDTFFSTGDGAGFRFSTGASDTQFQCVSGDGVGEKVTASGVTVATTTPYILRIEHDPRLTSAQNRFYINGKLCATHTGATDKVESGNQGCRPYIMATDLATGGKQIRVAKAFMYRH
jgi:hypothetical protein